MARVDGGVEKIGKKPNGSRRGKFHESDRKQKKYHLEFCHEEARGKGSRGGKRNRSGALEVRGGKNIILILERLRPPK